MPQFVNGEPYIHGLDPDQDAQVDRAGSNLADALAHQQNTDKGTNQSFFEIGRGSAYSATGAVRRGLLLNPGGSGPFTAFAWEAQDNSGTATGRWVECLNVVNGDVTNAGNAWNPALFGAAIPANDATGQPSLGSARAGILYLLGKLSAPTPPVIGGFNPTTGSAGDTVYINGNNFGTTTGSVTLGAKTCTVQGWSNSQITVRIPVGATTAKFTVTTAGGEDISRDNFTVAELLAPTKPGAPSNLNTIPGNGKVILSWDAPADQGSAPVNNYGIEYKAADALEDVIWTFYRRSVSIGTTATVTGLTNAQAYKFRVYAYNPVGASPASGIVTETPQNTAIVYRATEQTYVTTDADLETICGAGTTALPVTGTSSDGVSSTSQTAANAIALSRAKQIALAGVVCPFVPGTLSLADGSVTNPKLAADVKIGSVSATAQAFPQADRPVLTSVGAFLVYLINYCQGLLSRIVLLEARPSSGGGGGSGTVTAVKINNGTPVLPDGSGVVALTIAAGGVGSVSSASINGGAVVTPDSAGNLALTVSTNSTTVDANLTTNPSSTANAASVKAVNDGLSFKLDKSANASAADVAAGTRNDVYATPESLAAGTSDIAVYLQDIPDSVKTNVGNSANWNAANQYTGPIIPAGLLLKVYFFYPTDPALPAYKYEFWPGNKVVRYKLTN